jgi:hypothetical protein
MFLTECQEGPRFLGKLYLLAIGPGGAVLSSVGSVRVESASEVWTRRDAISESWWPLDSTPTLCDGIRCRRSPHSRLGSISNYLLGIEISQTLHYQFLRQLQACIDSDPIRARPSVIIRPASLKHLPHSADIAGINKASNTSRDRLGY